MKGSVAATTLAMQEAVLALLAESVGWDLSLERIASKDIERFRSERLGKGISVASANRELRTLKRIFTLAVQRGYLRPGGNPCSQIAMVKVGRKRPRYCRPDEFKAVCRAANDPLWLAFLMVVYTAGLRLMEAINLTWNDIDFEVGEVHVTRKAAGEYVQAWTPKDKELREIPLPEQTINLLAAWQPFAPEGCPYVFMELGRWEFFRQAVEEGRWQQGTDLVNNMLRRFKTLCRKAKVGPFTIHDLRRSCISNWARHLPIHVVQELAGHSDIKTTQQYYLSVRPEDVAKAQAVQAALVKDILPVNPTDPKLTQMGKKRVFPGRQGCRPKEKPPDSQGFLTYARQELNL